MGSSPERAAWRLDAVFIAVALAAWAASGCSVGVGSGAVDGVVSSPECDLDNEAYSLRPTFFGGDVLDVDGQYEIRVQRGGDLEGFSDGLRILVRDPVAVRGMLGAPIALGPESLVRMNLYLNETCPVDFTSVPVNLTAVSGTITFASIYAPDVASDEVVTEATFTGVRLEEPTAPEARNAMLDGNFRFLFNRGRPAQRYP